MPKLTSENDIVGLKLESLRTLYFLLVCCKQIIVDMLCNTRYQSAFLKSEILNNFLDLAIFENVDSWD